jgi:hypothetical protein
MAIGLGCLSLTVFPCPPSAASIFELQVGDFSPTNITAPARLTVTDPVRTEELRRQAVQRIPVVFRFDSNVVHEVQAKFHAGLDERRDDFLRGLRPHFKDGALSLQSLTNAQYERFCAAFLQQNQHPAVHRDLLALWAQGKPDDLLRGEWDILLRAFMEHYIRPDALAESARLGAPVVWMLPADVAVVPVDFKRLDDLSLRVRRTNVVTLSKLKQDVLNQFPPSRQAAAQYLAGLLRANCTWDEALTHAIRAQQTEPILGAVKFMPGQTILQAGQMVDPLARAALDQLQEREAIARQAYDAARAADDARPGFWWLAGGVAAFLVGFAALGWWWRGRRERGSQSLALVGHAASSLACPHCATPITAPVFAGAGNATWQARALAAERRADQAAALVRAGVWPQVAHWLKQRFVRSLIAQRDQALEVHEQTADDLVAIEQRLAQVQAPLADKLRIYESRISMLERHLGRTDVARQE